MNADVTHGPWGQFKFQLRKTWRELTDADLEVISQGQADLAQIVQIRCRGERGVATKPPRLVSRNVQSDSLPQARRRVRTRAGTTLTAQAR